ncbi:MAG: tetratricopeptide repeat protein [Candidatus Zixiibacteriota bacterium]|nr:MAG: tetratricopeptide repeat protein [candidate division Zixibacteria bacterium]
MSKTRNNKRRRKGTPSNTARKRAGGPQDKSSLDRLLTAHRNDPGDIGAILDLAEFYETHDSQDELLKMLRPLEDNFTFDRPGDRLRFDRLMAFTFIRSKRYLEAERVVKHGLEGFPDSIDLYYCLAYLKTSMREYGEAIAASEKYLALFSTHDVEGSVPCQTATSSHRSQLLNFVATSYKELGDPDRAVVYFEEAITSDPANHLPYLNLASLLAQQQKIEKAEQVVKLGLDNCRQVHELRMVLEGYQKKTTVSACMIVKNEEDMLEECLLSIRDWVDEIVLVDTGSTDRTIEIAESYGARIFHQKWEGDFSKARNYSLEHASSDWIFIIDADERVVAEDVPQIIRFLNEGKHAFISVNVINIYGESEEMTTFLPSERFFKRELNLRYKGIVHNQLDVPPGLSAVRTPIRIKHYGYGLSPDKMLQKLARSRELLEKQLEQDPDNAFAHFNLAQLLRAGEKGFPEENASEIIRHAGRGVELTDPDKSNERHIHLMCIDQLAWTYFHTGQFDKAEQFSRQALEYKADYLDSLLLLGHISMRRYDFRQAIKRYETYLEVQASYDPGQELSNIILFHVDSRATAYYSLAVAWQGLGDTGRARENYEHVLKLNPTYLDANTRLGRLHIEENRIDEAEICFQRQLTHGETSLDAALGMAAIRDNREDHSSAEEYYLKALDLAPDDPVAVLKLARFYERIDRQSEATEHLERVVGRGLMDLGVEKELAALYFGLGEFEKAAETYGRLVTRNLGDAEILNDLGNCHFKQSKYEQAEKYYQKALECTPSLDLAYRNLGLTRIRLDQPKGAIWALERFLDVNPTESALLHLVAELYAETGDFESAIPYYEKYLTSHPDDPQGLFGISECYLHMGHTDSAILGYRRAVQIDPSFEAAQNRLNSLTETVGRS